MKKHIKSGITDIAIGIVLTLITLAAFYFEWIPTQFLECKMYDVGSNIKEKNVQSPVVIVGIDDESIANMGRWPWPRGYVAQMIELMHRYEAKVIGVNFIYSENDFNQGLLAVRELVRNIENDPGLLKNKLVGEIHASLKESEKKLDNDAILSSSIGESKKVVLPLVFILGSSMKAEGTDVPEYLKQNSLQVSHREAE